MAESGDLNVTLNTRFALPYKLEGQLLVSVLQPTWPVIIFFGLLANLVNIVIFIKTGIRDSVTTLLCSLAVSDFFYLLFACPFVATFIIFNFAPNWDWPFDMNITFYLFYWPSFAMYDFSAYVAVSTGVMRCACVAMPLRFKSVFTKSRTVTLVVVLFVFAVALRMPVITMFRLVWRINPATNTSTLRLRSSNRKSLHHINDLLNRNSLPFISFIIMIACVIILTTKLYEATRVRRSHTAQSHKEISIRHPNDLKQYDAQRMSAKDIQVVQSVVLVCSIFIMSQLPFSVYSTARLIEPEFDDTGYYQHLFNAITAISYTCSFLNASVNIFVYYRYNSKYRAAFLSVLKRKTACKQSSVNRI
ncbi:chemosensory receptor a [Plakobranchus ocellatus]|uniref:Chemosensory receptor a n=1 Tax=Plakobranchus ocellatus TaxID=259542 RepID=A0AAV4B198_9GAST|nr:chemosensory receptor a [Plakobranchus ocellatus]